MDLKKTDEKLKTLKKKLLELDTKNKQTEGDESKKQEEKKKQDDKVQQTQGVIDGGQAAQVKMKEL